MSPDSAPVMALSADGERVVAVSNPRLGNGCSQGQSAFSLRGGAVQSGSTNWDDHQEWLEGFPGNPCAPAQHVQVALSDDGTSGLVVWNAVDPVSQGWDILFAKIVWPAGNPYPTILQNSRVFSVTESLYPNYEPFVGIALSRDGSRAVIEWALNVGLAGNNFQSTFGYSVIDMQEAWTSTAQVLPGGTFPGFAEKPNVGISDDGSVVMLSSPGHPSQASAAEFRVARVFTCSHNCYPTRLKRFEATVAAGLGGSNLAAFLSAKGDRAVIAWAQQNLANKATIAAFAPNALVPSAPGTVTSLNPKLKTISTEAAGAQFVFAVNESATKLAFMSQGISTQKVTTASIASNLAISAGVTTPMFPANTNLIAELRFANATATSPERLVARQVNVSGGNTVGQSVIVSDSATKPLNWAVVSTATAPDSGWLSSGGFALSRGSSKIASYSQTVRFNNEMFEYQYAATAVVSVAKNVLTPTTQPGITGTGAYNKALTLNPGKWNTGATVSYVWKRDGVALDPQPSGLKYTPLADEDMGLRMSATVTVTKAGFYDSVLNTAASAVMNGKPSRTTLSIVDATGPNNTPVDGNSLTYATVGSSPSVGLEITTRTWKVGTRVVGTGTSYVVQPGDVGKKISLTIKFSASNWSSTTVKVTTPAVLPAGR